MKMFFYTLGLMTGISLSAFFNFFMMVKFKSLSKSNERKERFAVSSYRNDFRYSGKRG